MNGLFWIKSLCLSIYEDKLFFFYKYKLWNLPPSPLRQKKIIVLSLVCLMYIGRDRVRVRKKEEKWKEFETTKGVISNCT